MTIRNDAPIGRVYAITVAYEEPFSSNIVSTNELSFTISQ